MKSLLILILATLLLAGCASAPQQQEPQQTQQELAAQQLVESIIQQALAQVQEEAAGELYDFQHKLLPEWTHHSNGEFYADLINGEHRPLRDAAEEMIDLEYSEAIVIQIINNADAVLITFPEPKSITHCYYVLIQKIPGVDGALDTFEYITLEKTFPDENYPQIAVLGDWDAEGAHGNYGERPYTDAQSFISDVLSGEREIHMRTSAGSKN